MSPLDREMQLNLGSLSSYGDAFRRLSEAGLLEPALADRLARAAGFRNLVAHACEGLDMARIYEAARSGQRICGRSSPGFATGSERAMCRS